jgi:hypothetical protein
MTKSQELAQHIKFFEMIQARIDEVPYLDFKLSDCPDIIVDDADSTMVFIRCDHSVTDNPYSATIHIDSTIVVEDGNLEIYSFSFRFHSDRYEILSK